MWTVTDLCKRKRSQRKYLRLLSLERLLVAVTILMAYQDDDEDLEPLRLQLANLQEENEKLRKENDLFESYLNRNGQSDLIEEEQGEVQGKGKGRRKQQQQEKRTLTIDEKNEIANAELESLKENIQKGEDECENLLDVLRAMLDDIDMTIGEIKREAHDFKREIVVGAENPKTGKIIAEKLIKYIEEKMNHKDAVIDKFKQKNYQLQQHIAKAEKQINLKKKMSDDLKFIDFHQLQIENRKHVKEIEERNKKLVSLKMTTGKTVSRLNDEKNKLSKEEKELADLTASIEEAKRQLQEIDVESDEVRKKEARAQLENKRLKQQQERLENMPSVMGYIAVTEKLKERSKQLKNIDRKIDVLGPSFRKATKTLRTGQSLSLNPEQP